MKTLNSAERKFLKAKAHHLNPLVLIGQNGLTENVIQKTDQVLLSHELIKVKFLDYKDEKKELVEQLVQATDSYFVSTIGHIAILYRPHPEAEKRKIILP